MRSTSFALLRASEHLCYRGRQLSPGVFLDFGRPATAPGELVILGAPVILARAPAGLDPAAPLQPVKSGIERPLLNTQRIAGDLLNTLRYRPAALRFKNERLQDQQIQCPAALRPGFPSAIFIYFISLPLLQEKNISCLVEAQGKRVHLRFTQRDQGVYFRRTPGWQIAGQNGDRE
jgi:hypothetical protein